MGSKIRIQKIIANAGISSRREAEKMILEGLVTINGKVVKELGTQVDPEQCHIKVRGKLIRPQTRKITLALHKPSGVVTTLHDPEGRPTVTSLLRGVRERVVPVGRLDYNSEGLLIMTNDGDLANLLMHPKYHLPKVYTVKVKGKPDPEKLRKLSRGTRLPEGMTGPSVIRKVHHYQANTSLEITLYEGKNRQIRRMFSGIGHPVLKLKRIRIGPIHLKGLAPGSYRRLEKWEIEELTAWTTRAAPRKRKAGRDRAQRNS